MDDPENLAGPPKALFFQEKIYIAVELIGNQAKLYSAHDLRSWQQVQLPRNTTHCFALAHDNSNIFMAYATTDESTPMIGRFDGESWEVSRRPCPINQRHPGLFVTDGHIILVGGHDGKRYLSDSTSYDLERHSWSHAKKITTTCMQLNIFPALPSARSQPKMLCFENEWHAVGGSSGVGGPTPILNLTAQSGVKTWVEADLPRLNSFAAVTKHQGWLWAAGGYNSRGSRVATVDCVDTRNGAVVEMPPLPIACSNAALVIFKNKLVLYGGYTCKIHGYNDLLTLDLSH